jgi:hypothetical protein
MAKQNAMSQVAAPHTNEPILPKTYLQVNYEEAAMWHFNVYFWIVS